VGLERIRAYSAELLAVAAAAAWFWYLGYGVTLDPRDIEWMLWGDWVTPLWSFSFFRNADWAWPLGALPNYFYPFGTSVGFADGNPLVSSLFRLFSPWLPLHFQWAGMWFLLCFVLQAYFGVRFTALWSKSQIERALGGILFALTPVLPMRSHHVVLSGVFLITGSLYFAVKPCADRKGVWRSLALALALVFWASGSNGYHSIMVFALYVALCVRLRACDRLLSTREAGLAILAGLAVLFATYFLVGWLGYQKNDLKAEGFGWFSSDLSTLFNPLDWSRFLDGYPIHPRQWEGAAYLGLGVLALLGLRLALASRAPGVALRQLRSHWPVCAVLVLMTAYALSSRVTLFGVQVLSLESLYARLSKITDIFRSSGRFIWALHMALIAVGVSAALSFSSRWRRIALLLVAVLVQASELKASNIHFAAARLTVLPHPAWAASAKDYRHLAILPAQIQWVCPYNEQLVNMLSYEAYRRKWTFNSGVFGRGPTNIQALCSKGLPAEGLDAHTIYVIPLNLLPQLQSAGAACGAVDGLLVCVSAARPSPLRAALQPLP
jgi:hypothetical protein